MGQITDNYQLCECLIVVEISRGENTRERRESLRRAVVTIDKPNNNADDSDNDPDIPRKPKPKAFRLLRKPRSLTRVTAKRNRERSESERREVDTIDELNSNADDSDNDPDYLPRKPKPKAFRLLRKPRSLTRVTAKRNHERSESERRVVVTIDEPNNNAADFNVASGICSAAANSTTASKQARVRCRTKLQQNAYARTNHPMRDPCVGCKYDCSHNFDNSRRSAIWSSFWSQDYVGRKNWIYHTVERKPKKRKTAGDRSKRQLSFVYYLCNDDGVKIQVCKTFFLSTLGFHSKNDRFITTVMKTAKEAVFTSDSKRGKHPPANKKDTKIIKDHIMSFHPCVSHYRRAHAPNRLYLPSDITVKKMYNDLK